MNFIERHWNSWIFSIKIYLLIKDQVIFALNCLLKVYYDNSDLPIVSSSRSGYHANI